MRIPIENSTQVPGKKKGVPVDRNALQGPRLLSQAEVLD
jgi:hypothetical protein